MRYLARELKGTYGYIRRQTVFEIIKTIILFAMAFGIFLMGYLTLGTRKSLWSVFAVLALLPASKSLVGVIMLLRFRSLTPEQYDKYSSITGMIPVIYENVLTTTGRAYYLPVICCMASTVTAYTTAGSSEINALKSHIETVLKNGGHKAVVKIYDNESDFIQRIKQMTENLPPDGGVASVRILETLKAVSL